MPAMRPQDISNCVRRSNERRAEVRRLVSEDSAVDAVLPLAGSGVNAVVDEVSPNKHCVACLGSEDPLLARSDEQPAVSIRPGAVVPFIHLQAVEVAIF